MKVVVSVMFLAVSLAVQTANAAGPVGTAFTYQGRLQDTGTPASGPHDFEFKLFDEMTTGTQVGMTLCQDGVDVVDGLFTVELDFGMQFDGNARWVEIGVRADNTPANCDTGLYTTLSPRQPISPAPYALFALSGPGSGGSDWTLNGMDLYYTNGNVGIGTMTPTAALTIGGPASEIRVENSDGTETVEVLGGGAAAEGFVRLRNATSGATVVELDGDHGGSGGAFRLFGENGSTNARYEADIDGTGQYVEWYRGAGLTGLVFDGNADGNENPNITFQGTNATVSLNLTTTDNNAVVLPNNAVSAAEVLDEPGVANIQASGVAADATTMAPITSRSITVPADGFVLVLASADLALSHSSGTQSWTQFGVSTTNNSLPTNQDMDVIIPSGGATGTYDFAVVAHGLFQVTAGTPTFFLNARRFTGTNATFFDAQLTLIYFPTAYGTVQSNGALPAAGAEGNASTPTRSSLSAAEIEAERAQSIEANLDRMEAELKAQQAELEVIRAQLSKGNRRTN